MYLRYFLIASLLFVLSSCSDPKPESTPPAEDTTAEVSQPEEPAVEKTTPEEPASEPVPEPAAPDSNRVKLSTTMGDIVIELYPDKAPATVENFLSYVNSGFYDNTVFHRVISGFMIQGGGFGLTGNGPATQKETNPPVENEAKNGLKNVEGSVAMARTSDPHSATAQFFINHNDNANLDYPSFDGWGYAVFGKVVEGMDVVNKIADVQTTTKPLVGKMGPQPMQNVPVEDVIITSAKIVP